MKKDDVAGLGEIGYPILKILSKKQTTIGYDIDKRLMNNQNLKHWKTHKLLFYT